MLLPCYNWGNARGPAPGSGGPDDARGPDLNAVTRFNDTHRMTQDASFNLKWDRTDRLSLNFDAQYVDADLQNYDVEIGQYSFANVMLDTERQRAADHAARPDQHQPVCGRPQQPQQLSLQPRDGPCRRRQGDRMGAARRRRLPVRRDLAGFAALRRPLRRPRPDRALQRLQLGQYRQRLEPWFQPVSLLEHRPARSRALDRFQRLSERALRRPQLRQ